MAAATFDSVLPLVLKHEGGYVAPPKDPGGATNLGVTMGTLSDWLGRPATKAEVRARTSSKVAPIYRDRYWRPAGCDGLFPGVDYATFDAAVNSGVSRAKSWLAKAVGPSDHSDTVRRLCAVRMSFLRGLTIFKTFGKGWTRRVAEVEAHGVALALAAMGKPVRAELDKQRTEAERKAASASAGAGSSAAAGAGSGGLSADPNAVGVDPSLWIFLALLAAAALVAAFVFWRKRRVHAERARAYASVTGA